VLCGHEILIPGCIVNTPSVEGWALLSMGILLMQGSPGPAVFVLVANSLEYDQKLSFSLFAAFVLGQLTKLILGVAGLGMVLSSSPESVEYLRIIVAGLLVVMGFRGLIRSSISGVDFSHHTHPSSRRAIFSTWLIASTSPIGIVFYITVVPEFISISTLNANSYFTLVAIVLFTAAAIGIFYLYATFMMRKLIVSRSLHGAINSLSNTVLALTGIWVITNSIAAQTGTI